MSKTTPEEAELRAFIKWRKDNFLNPPKWDEQKLRFIDPIDQHGWGSWQGRAALIDEVCGVDAEPFMHVYEFASPFGGTVWRDSPDTWNGNQPKRSLPLYARPAPSQPAAPVELPVVGKE